VQFNQTRLGIDILQLFYDCDLEINCM